MKRLLATILIAISSIALIGCKKKPKHNIPEEPLLDEEYTHVELAIGRYYEYTTQQQTSAGTENSPIGLFIPQHIHFVVIEEERLEAPYKAFISYEARGYNQPLYSQRYEKATNIYKVKDMGRKFVITKEDFTNLGFVYDNEYHRYSGVMFK